MSLQHVNIDAEVESNGNMHVTITDRYDFDNFRTTWDSIKSSSLSSSIGNAANDFGIIVQTRGIIIPYDITIHTYEWAGCR